MWKHHFIGILAIEEQNSTIISNFKQILKFGGRGQEGFVVGALPPAPPPGYGHPVYEYISNLNISFNAIENFHKLFYVPIHVKIYDVRYIYDLKLVYDKYLYTIKYLIYDIQIRNKTFK